jgi:hypothetical protein
MTANEMWMANKYIKEPIGDGGNPRIPTLKTRNAAGADISVNNDDEKAKIFTSVFFPKPPPTENVFEGYEYPEPLPDPSDIMADQIKRHIAKTSPYKAHDPDEIPNVVLQQCVSLIIDRLISIYQAVLELDLYYEPWKEFTTVVLRKPGKPSYEAPKAYRPIALLSTLAKTLTSIIAENISNLR